MQHPNIVQVYEVGEHEGKPFFSMEFCPGGGLDRKLNGTPLPPAEAARLVETLARAVQAAHDKGVIHRDLKPANVLLAEDGTPKVTDFGLAKRMDAAGQTQTGAVLGTPSYMAPEQAGGQDQGDRAGDGRVRAGGDPVRVPDGPAAVQGADGAGHADAGLVGRPRAAAAVAAEDAARSGDDLSEMSGEAAGPALRDGGGAGGRPGAVGGGRAGAGAAAVAGVRAGETDPPPPDAADRGGGDAVAAGGGRDDGVRAAAGRVGQGAEELRDGGPEGQGFGEAKRGNCSKRSTARSGNSRSPPASPPIVATPSTARATSATASTGCCRPTRWRRGRIPCARVTSA